MLLGLSGDVSDAEVSYDLVMGSGDADGGVEHGKLLTSLAEAMWSGDSGPLAAARSALVDAMGEAALVDAVAVSANFHMMTRVADGTGTPLDRRSVASTEALRAQIGVDDFVSRRHRDPATDA
ncbi:MAG: hypothetical protein AB8G26_10570 [Ilumatobacter sp.]